MKEVIFQRELVRSIKRRLADVHCRKVEDTPGAPSMRFVSKKPYDIYFNYKGRFYAIECKMMKELSPFPLDRVKDHQVDGLKEVVMSGGSGLVAINYRCRDINEKKMRDFGLFKNHINMVFLFNINDFVFLIEKAKEENKKSITIELMRQYLKIMEYKTERRTTEQGKKVSEIIWDVEEIVD